MAPAAILHHVERMVLGRSVLACTHPSGDVAPGLGMLTWSPSLHWFGTLPDRKARARKSRKVSKASLGSAATSEPVQASMPAALPFLSLCLPQEGVDVGRVPLQGRLLGYMFVGPRQGLGGVPGAVKYFVPVCREQTGVVLWVVGLCVPVGDRRGGCRSVGSFQPSACLSCLCHAFSPLLEASRLAVFQQRVEVGASFVELLGVRPVVYVPRFLKDVVEFLWPRRLSVELTKMCYASPQIAFLEGRGVSCWNPPRLVGVVQEAALLMVVAPAVVLRVVVVPDAMHGASGDLVEAGREVPPQVCEFRTGGFGDVEPGCPSWTNPCLP